MRKKSIMELLGASTSSTDRLIGSSISSGLASGHSTAVSPAVFLHSLPPRQHSNSIRKVYRPTTVNIHQSGGKYEKVPTENLAYESVSNMMSVGRRKSSTGMQLTDNLRSAFDADSTKDRKELDLNNSTIQASSDDDESTDRGEARLVPQILAALSVSMGSLVVGYVSGYSSPAGDSMEEDPELEIPKSALSWIGGVMPLAALFGGVVGGPLIDAIGRKMTILATAIPFIISWLIIGFAINVPMILSGRIIAGFCVGIMSLVLPVYLGETVQPEVRGSLGLLPTAFGNTGILLVYSAGLFCDWQKLAFVGAGVPVLFLILCCIIPETPVWYFTKGKNEKARQSLQWLRGKNCDISEELQEIEKAVAKNSQSGSSIKTLFNSSTIKPILISIGLMVFQQFSGINAVIFYTVKIFRMIGSDIDKNICTIIVGVVNFFAAIAATTVIDRMGRKKLMYISGLMMIATLVTLGAYMQLQYLKYDLQNYSWIPLLSFVFYIIGFSVGFGPIPWLMMGELLPASVRGPAASLATGTNWACASLVALTFNDLMVKLGMAWTFWMFAIMCTLGLFFVIFFVPETQGQSLEDIERKFQKPVRRMSSIANLKPSPLAV